MRIAVVGGTGRVGRPLTLDLLEAGHSVRVLSRGGGRADELIRRGAELATGSFDSGTAAADFFSDTDAAFIMVRSDWGHPGHYAETAERLTSALRQYTPGRVVFLSSVGADAEDAGHSTDFGRVERALGAVVGERLVSLRAGWFMENFESHSAEILESGTMISGISLDVKLPLIATRDVARAAASALTDTRTPPGGVRELQGPADLTYPEAATVISLVSGRPVRAAQRATAPSPALAKDDPVVVARKRYAEESNAAFNEHRVRFSSPRDRFDYESTDFATFVREIWDLQPNEASAD